MGAAAKVLVQDPKKSLNKTVVTSGGVALVDAAGAARLLKANGVLESARQHMHFFKVVLKAPQKSALNVRARNGK